MARIFISPSKYIQGPGELAKLGEYTQAYGKSALVIITAGGLKRSGDVISKRMQKLNFIMTILMESAHRLRLTALCKCLMPAAPKW